ncbi:hypothetical protein WICPIJ_005962, partial [Wickerhamomyces pijperi]
KSELEVSGKHALDPESPDGSDVKKQKLDADEQPTAQPDQTATTGAPEQQPEQQPEEPKVEATPDTGAPALVPANMEPA